MAYRTTKHSAIGVTSFLLIYGREAVLPIDETKPLTIHECMMSIVEEISHIREEARLMIQKAQDHMIQQIPGKERKSIVGEEVLYRDSARNCGKGENFNTKIRIGIVVQRKTRTKMERTLSNCGRTLKWVLQDC